MREVIGRYVDIRIMPAICPLHSPTEKTLILMGDRWRCRTCEAGGTVEDFVTQIMETQDRRWQEFQALFNRLCSEWGYKNLKLPREEMETTMQERTEMIIRAGESRKGMSLTQLIGSYIPLVNGESQCPWCSGRLQIIEERWHCEGCKESGDILDFISKYEHVSRARAREMLSAAKSSS